MIMMVFVGGDGIWGGRDDNVDDYEGCVLVVMM